MFRMVTVDGVNMFRMVHMVAMDGWSRRSAADRRHPGGAEKIFSRTSSRAVDNRFVR